MSEGPSRYTRCLSLFLINSRRRPRRQLWWLPFHSCKGCAQRGAVAVRGHPAHKQPREAMLSLRADGTRLSSGMKAELRAVIWLQIPKSAATVGTRLSAVDAPFLCLVAPARSAPAQQASSPHPPLPQLPRQCLPCPLQQDFHEAHITC